MILRAIRVGARRLPGMTRSSIRVGLGPLVLGLAACGPAATPPAALTPVTVQLNWFHQSQLGGLYAADQTGLYRAEGLAVTFVPGGPKVDTFAPVVAGQAQFGVAGADELILARAQGQPVRAIAAIYRRSPIVFVARADAGITRPQDFVGRTIRISPNILPTFRTMMARAGIPPDRYREIQLPSEVAAFASGQAPIWGVYVNGLAVALQRAGHQLSMVFPDDYGVHFYADTVFTSDPLIATKPELVTRFLRATLQGWTHAIENPATIGPMVLKYKPDADLALEAAKMTATLPLVHTGEDHLGWMKPEIWSAMETVLRQEGVLTAPLDVTQVYTLEFLQALYRSRPAR